MLARHVIAKKIVVETPLLLCVELKKIIVLTGVVMMHQFLASRDVKMMWIVELKKTTGTFVRQIIISSALRKYFEFFLPQSFMRFSYLENF